MLKALPVALLVALTLALPASAANLTASQLSEIFCIGRTSTEMAPFETLLTTDLANRIADARSRLDAFAKAHPGEKSPLPDGIPWQGNPAYARDCQIVGMTGTGDAPQAVIAYTFDDPSQNIADKLVLNFVNGNLRLDNILYGKGGDLRSALASAFQP